MNDATLLRYSRQILLPDVDAAGQQRWLDSRALVIGLGGLGSAVAFYLAAAGVGELILNDDDRVDASNLQRQIIHRESHLGWPKTDSAAQSLRDLNPHTKLTLLSHRLTAAELARTVGQADVVLDCSDNFASRFAINAACVAQGKPLISGAAIRFEGQLCVFIPGNGPCYRCLYQDSGEAEESCTDNGVIAPLVGVIGSLQALEALKVLLQQSESGKLLLFDAKRLNWRSLNVPRDPHCPVCGQCLTPAPFNGDAAGIKG